jgi:hypothetical protein
MGVSMTRDNINDVSISLAIEYPLGNPLSRFIINRLSKKKNGTGTFEEALFFRYIRRMTGRTFNVIYR